tara:strand:- start:1711 stop:2088 length:378 start_codon:yes stop_codon:yes gene_type:complete
MKNLKEIKQEIAAQEVTIKKMRADKERTSKIASATKHLEMLCTIEKYLEFSPSQDFCQKELDRVTRIVDLSYESWEAEWGKLMAMNPRVENLPKASITAKKKAFLKGMNLTDLKKQVATLVYILK